MIASKDIKPITDLKRNTKAVLDELHSHKRPVILTLKGRPNSVIIDIETYEKQVSVANLSRMLQEGEQDIREGDVRSAKTFLKKFKNEK
jgi:prevent-host-death family protein